MSSQPKVALIILDGWGLGPRNDTNPLSVAKVPVFNRLWRTAPHISLHASGRWVGLPPRQAGNSEAGHMNIGAGRIVEQDAVRISHAINAGTFFHNPVLTRLIAHVKQQRSALHLMGLLSSSQSAHVDPDHLFALLSLARLHRVRHVYLHLFTDGRDSPRHAALKLVNALLRTLRPNERVATVMGRFYAMDRNKNWIRTKLAYDAMVRGSGLKAPSPQAAITEAYNREETDEFIPPYVITQRGQPVATIGAGDGVMYYNLRSDRARQLAKPFAQVDFERLNAGAFRRGRRLQRLAFVTMTDFGPDLDHISAAYPSLDVVDTLPMAAKSLRQVYLAESEKFAHVTFFINGGYADPVAGEDRVKVPSPVVQSYAATPEMAAIPLTDAIVGALDHYDLVVANYANADMIGHTGDFAAGVAAAECIDACLGRLLAAARRRQATVVITADHGNLEQMKNPRTGEIDTEHSHALVPFIVVSPRRVRLAAGDHPLAAVAPTVLQLLGVPIPKLMTEKSLIVNHQSSSSSPPRQDPADT